MLLYSWAKLQSKDRYRPIFCIHRVSRPLDSTTIPYESKERMSDGDNSGWQTFDGRRSKREQQRRRRQPEQHNPREQVPRSKKRYEPPLPFSVEYIHPTAKTLEFQQFMLLLCGIPGSGKSTFAKALERAMPYKVRMSTSVTKSSCRCTSYTVRHTLFGSSS